jgi:muconolactone delta-isomerase
MLFYVQMRWNHEGRLSLDDLWEIEAEEAERAKETLEDGTCVGIWKVAAQRRVIAVVDMESALVPQRPYFSSPNFLGELEAYNNALDAAMKELVGSFDAMVIVGGS